MTKGEPVNFLIISLALIILSFNCAPERDNPYDPKSPYSNYSQISGRIITKVGNPIAHAKILLLFQNISKTVSTESDTNGNYVLEYYYSISQGDSAVLNVIKNNYADCQKVISIAAKEVDTINFMLDALPQFAAESVISIHEYLVPFPGEIFNAIFTTVVNDADGPGDIDSVFAIIPALSKLITLDYFPGNIYRKTVPVESFPGVSLENLIGTDCYFEVLNKSKVRTRSNAIRLNRIIYDVPIPIEPFEDTVSQNFTCTWNSMSLSFNFTYGVEIYYLNPAPVLVFDSTDISSADTMVIVPKSLTSGRYYWQTLIKDTFGNISKSMQLLFYYQAK